MWGRKNRFERSIDSLESEASAAVEQLADTIKTRLNNETGKQLAVKLNKLADQVDQLDLSDVVVKQRRALQKAARRANRQVDRAMKDLDRARSKVAHNANVLAERVGGSLEQGGQQIATLGQKSVPSEPTGWILPTFIGFLCGFGAGFLVARNGRKDSR